MGNSPGFRTTHQKFANVPMLLSTNGSLVLHSHTYTLNADEYDPTVVGNKIGFVLFKSMIDEARFLCLSRTRSPHILEILTLTFFPETDIYFAFIFTIQLKNFRSNIWLRLENIWRWCKEHTKKAPNIYMAKNKVIWNQCHHLDAYVNA